MLIYVFYISAKKLWELIEPVEKRVAAVLAFLNDINPNLEYNVLPIQDIYGPTKDDPRYQASYTLRLYVYHIHTYIQKIYKYTINMARNIEVKVTTDC